MPAKKYDVLDDIHAERIRQDEKWGIQHHLDGTSNDEFSRLLRDAARTACVNADAQGKATWWDILYEEVMEASAEEDWRKLRAELVQVAAVAVAWIEDGDQRQ